MKNAASWQLTWDRGEAEVAPLGAMLAPVNFDIGDGRRVQPFAIAPWSKDHGAEHDRLPPLLRQLRGEWIGVPFGMPSPPEGLPTRWQQQTPTTQDFGSDFHGHSSNATWECVSRTDGSIELKLDYPSSHALRSVTRRITGIAGKARIDLNLTINARVATELPLGIHPVFRLPATPGAAELTFSGVPKVHTYPVAAEPGVSRLEPDQWEQRLNVMPCDDGSYIDLTRLPLAFPTEELVLVTGHGGKCSLINHEEGYMVCIGWDAAAFPSCLLWISNRGRKSYPWSSRFLAIGIEPIVAPFDLGVAVARSHDNPLRRAGISTARLFSANETWTTSYWIEVSSATTR